MVDVAIIYSQDLYCEFETRDLISISHIVQYLKVSVLFNMIL